MKLDRTDFEVRDAVRKIRQASLVLAHKIVEWEPAPYPTPIATGAARPPATAPVASSCVARHDPHDCAVPGACGNATLAMLARLSAPRPEVDGDPTHADGIARVA